MRWFTTAEVFKSVRELKSAIVTAYSNNCHKRFLTEVSVNGMQRRLENVVQCNDGLIEHVC